MSCATPHSAEPARNSTIAACSTILRPYRSPSLPYSGSTMVDDSRYAVTTHDNWSSPPSPPSSPTIVGSAVDTIVWSSADSSMTSSSAATISPVGASRRAASAAGGVRRVSVVIEISAMAGNWVEI